MPKESFNPSSIVITKRFSNGLNTNYIFFSNNEQCLNSAVVEEMIKKVDLEIISKINNKKCTKKIKKRDPIESRLRHEVFKRDRYKCVECSKSKEETTLHCDHILPVAQGGTDELSNLQTLCEACNLAKSNRKWEGGLTKNE